MAEDLLNTGLLSELAAADRPMGTGVIPNLDTDAAQASGEAVEAAADLPDKIDDYTRAVATSGVPWVPIIKRLSINLFIPFINGIMLGFGEIIAHEIGLVFGWRTARVVDPTLRPPATNPKHRRQWLFGFL